MKTTFFIIIGFCILPFCYSQHFSKDNIIEKNLPDNLDLSKHQIFLDTTKTNEYYDIFNCCNPLFNLERQNQEVIKDFASKIELKKIDLKDFPRCWMSLQQLNDEYVLYCELEYPFVSYGLTDSVLINNAGHSFNFFVYDKLLEQTEKRIVIELNSLEYNGKATITIEQTSNPNIYQYLYNIEGKTVIKNYITPVDKLRNFNLIINNRKSISISEYKHLFKGFSMVTK